MDTTPGGNGERYAVSALTEDLERASTIAGELAVGYVSGILTASGRIHAVWPNWQHPGITADIAADLADHFFGDLTSPHG